MKYKILLSRKFKKNYAKLDKHEKTQLKRKLKLFVDNPFHPSLRSKRIKGLENLFEFSINMDVRVIWCYQNGKLILLLDIGHHNILKHLK